jgi:tetratricopeptide (TPR) repeat protein
MFIFNKKKPKIKLMGKIGLLNLDAWYLSLTDAQKERVKNYSGEGDELTTKKIINTSQTQKHFFWSIASNAYFEKDYKFSLFIALQAFNFAGDLVDDHFLYNTIIETYDKLNDRESLVKFCYEEIYQFNRISIKLKEKFGGNLPPSIPSRDFLLRLATDNEDYDEAIRLIEIFKEKSLLNDEEAELKKIEFHKESLFSKAFHFLEKDNIDTAKSILEQITSFDINEVASVNKILGNYYYDKGLEIEAYNFYKKAIQANPEIKGIKTKFNKVSKNNNLPIDFN